MQDAVKRVVLNQRNDYNVIYFHVSMLVLRLQPLHSANPPPAPAGGLVTAGYRSRYTMQCLKTPFKF